MRIIIGGIMQESNTFSLARADMAYFHNVWLEREAMAAMRGVQSEIGGFYRAAAEEGDVVLVAAFFTHAVSANRVAGETFGRLKAKLLEEISAALPADGVLLALHGAMVAEGCDDADGELIAAVRSRIGPDVPLSVSLDFHANVTAQMVRCADAIVGYQTYPHVDHTETGMKAAKLLFRMVRTGFRPHIGFVKVPMIVPAENSQTDSGPMAAIISEAQQGERQSDVLHSSLFVVQPWLDIEEMGSSVVVVSETEETAGSEARRLAERLWESREAFKPELYDIADMVERVRSDKGRDRKGEAGWEPYIVSDSADSSGAGSTGDSAFVLRRLKELGAHRDLVCLLNIVDEAVVEQAVRAGVGNAIRCRIGHTLDPRYGEPVEIEAYVRLLYDGKYRYGKGFYRNMKADMGTTAVLQVGTVSLLVMGRTSLTVDPAMYRSAGLNPAEADLVLVKSANQFKACYRGVSTRTFILDTPGCSTADLTSLSFTKLPKPFYPFEEFNWEPGNGREGGR